MITRLVARVAVWAVAVAASSGGVLAAEKIGFQLSGMPSTEHSFVDLSRRKGCCADPGGKAAEKGWSRSPELLHEFGIVNSDLDPSGKRIEVE